MQNHGSGSIVMCCTGASKSRRDVTHLTPVQVISASSDATVRVWDAKSCECTTIFKCAVTLVLHMTFR
jgi:WD40 repeat protein